MDFGYDSFPTTPLISQHWRVSRYKWVSNVPSGGIVHLQYLRSDHGLGLGRFIQREKCIPWMADYLIRHQATARGEVQLVQDAVTKRVSGHIAMTGNPHRKAGLYVVVNVPGGVRYARLCAGQYSTSSNSGLKFEELRFGHRVDVEMVRLPKGCWVGPKFVLPDIPYHFKRPPFLPSLAPKHKTTRSREGEYFPCRIRR